MKLEPVIGLEIHVQLKTKTKMYCGCSAYDTAVPANTHVCPICLAEPGVLPVPNEQAIRFTILMGLALHGTIAEHSKFDRKNYFYPDLPKAYQISQYDLPIVKGGFLDIEIPLGIQKTARIDITRIHLEEDAAKSFHGTDGKSFVDFNRAGTPLMEIVTEPDVRSPLEAKMFLQELRLIARYLGISDADMEKGHLRCDANISLRPIDEDGNVIGPQFHPKTEVKNINSFRHVERALHYEIERQTKLWEMGTPPNTSTTRGWNDVKQITEEQRSKEEAADYRYFPEPDIPALALRELAEELKQQLPELPAARRERFTREYLLKPTDAKQICDDPALADFTERVFSELAAWMEALPELDGIEAREKEKERLARLVSGWLTTKLLGLLADQNSDIRIMKVSPENFAELMTLIATRKLNNATALKVLEAILEDGSDPTHIMEDQHLGQLQDEGMIAEAVERTISAHPVELARYQAGEKHLLKFFIGLVMKETEGTAEPGLVQNMLLVKLEKEALSTLSVDN